MEVPENFFTGISLLEMISMPSMPSMPSSGG